MNVKVNFSMKTVIKTAAVAMAFFYILIPLKAVSLAELAADLRKNSHFYMVSLETPISNFGSEENKKSYAEIKKKYTSALGFYYERDYAEAYRLYSEVQKSIESLAEDLSLQYIERTQKILVDFTSRIIDLETKYDKSSELAKTLRTNRVSYYDAEAKKELMSNRFYSPKIVHKSYDRFSILDNLEYGYGNLGKAKFVRERAQAQDKYLLEGQAPTTRMRDKKVRAYIATIKHSREAKANALRMFQLYNRLDEYTVQGNVIFDKETKEFKENPFLVESRIDPIFDQRIPEEYRIDAEDVLNRNYKEQMQMKIEGKAFGEEEDQHQEPQTQAENQ